ncbi:hypothetical protein [Hymenobacter sp. BT190]|uniref:hypothetical protein n=1 Tax=Hymenobacter sp. BT190 TaxID=2763505 RepID=UPI0016511D9D|nr:hypothetical protein [Hymenobacter sp. BT190]MBC6698005.1 hypothetical protein [Hymenobacter sp. BT190]
MKTTIQLMPKRRNLNGIPHNITQSFFGTERYYSCGYMGDWLLNAARQLNLTKASLNVMTATFEPAELNIQPLTLNARELKSIIARELLANGFESTFITEAHIDFQFLNPNVYRTTLYCFPYLVDKHGKRYESGRIIADGFESDFDVFDEKNIHPAKKETSILDKLKGLFDQ